MAQRRKLHDQYFKLAKAQGYLARSAFKLIEIDERFKLFGKSHSSRQPACILDVGCAPGSWLQVAAQRAGARATILGLDLKAVTHPMPPTVKTIVADAQKIDPSELIETAGGRFTLIISDMAPNTTGHGDDDKSAQLCQSPLRLVPALIAPHGHLVMKILEGQAYPQVLKETKALFAQVKGFKPKASRDASREMFIVAKDYTGPICQAQPGTSEPSSSTRRQLQDRHL